MDLVRPALLAMLSCSAAAYADPHFLLRMSSAAPEGTAWAREMRAFSREVARQTKGQVEIKWYLGGITGDETQALARIQRGQLDGMGAAQVCHHVAPSLKATIIAGPFQSHIEHRYVLGRLRQQLDADLAKNGLVGLGWASLGGVIFFTREPVHTLYDLRRLRIWVWDLDDVSNAMMPRVGVKVVSLPIGDAARAYQDGRVDGFLATPTAGLAYQWSTQARYLIDLRAGYVSGCLLVAQRAFDALPVDAQRVLRAAGAELAVRFEELGKAQDAQLVGGLFDKQGLRTIPVSPSLRAEFYEAARRAREELGDRLVPTKLFGQVLGWLADYRAQNPVGNQP
jgi:TRAP-type C4-dicarboxylate transport system substrate-binding protein